MWIVYIEYVRYCTIRNVIKIQVIWIYRNKMIDMIDIYRSCENILLNEDT